MLSNDTIEMADFGLCLEGETWSDCQSIPSWNAMPQTLGQVEQVQWSQQPHTQYGCMWQNEKYSTAAMETRMPWAMPTIPIRNDFLLDCPNRALNSSTQFMQPPRVWPDFTSGSNQSQIHNRAPASNHHAQITITHTPAGTPKMQIKRKRKRTAFTTDQILAMERVFHRSPYVGKEERQALAENLLISDRAVKVWFQNRRIKKKREEMEAQEDCILPDSSPSATTSSSDSVDLTYVQAKMSHSTNELGFVTLDDLAMDELVKAIDTAVTDDVSCEVLDEEVKYEPVSPGPYSDQSEEEAAKWNPPKPEESLKKLFEIHQ